MIVEQWRKAGMDRNGFAIGDMNRDCSKWNNEKGTKKDMISILESNLSEDNHF